MCGVKGLGALVVLALAAAAVVGCAEAPREAGESVGVVQSSLIETYQIRLGSGVSLLESAIVSDGELKIGDRVTIKNADGAPAAISNSGSGLTRLGANAKVGSVRSQGGIELAGYARIEGNARSGGAINPQANAVITGTSTPNSAISPFSTESVSTDFGAPSLGDIMLEPPNPPIERVTTLAPGTYGKLVVKSLNRVNLSGGTYHFNELQVEPQGRLVLSDANQAVRLNVKTTLLFKGKVESVTGEHPALRLVYVGTTATVIEPPFAGTLIAPRASVRLASVVPPAQHVGSFFAKDLEISPDVTVVFRPSFRYVATETWSAPNVEYGGFSRGAALSTGGAVFAAEKHAYRLDAAGNRTTYVPGGTDQPTVVDADTGRWGYRTAAGLFRAFRPDGTLLREIALEPASTPLFVFGAEKLVVLVGQTSREGHPYSAARFVDLTTGATNQFVATGMEWGDASSTRFIYTTPSQLIAKNHSGGTLWSTSTPLREFRLSSNGSRLIGVRKKGSVVVNIDAASGAITSEQTLPAPLWELGASPTGKRTFAATQTELFVFKDGVLERRIKPPLAYFASAEINDWGEIVIGGKQADFETRLFLRGPAGTDPWQGAGPVDNQGYRPFVFLHPTSNGFFTVRKGGAASFSIARRLL